MVRNIIFIERPEGREVKYRTSGGKQKGTGVPGPTGRKLLAEQHILDGYNVFWVYIPNGVGDFRNGPKGGYVPPGRYGLCIDHNSIHFHDMIKTGTKKELGVMRARHLLSEIISWAIGDGEFIISISPPEGSDGDANDITPTRLETSEPYSIEHTLSRMIQMLMYSIGNPQSTFERAQSLEYGISVAKGPFAEEAVKQLFEEEKEASAPSGGAGAGSKSLHKRKPSSARLRDRRRGSLSEDYIDNKDVKAGSVSHFNLIVTHESPLKKKGGMLKTWVPRCEC